MENDLDPPCDAQRDSDRLDGSPEAHDRRWPAPQDRRIRCHALYHLPQSSGPLQQSSHNRRRSHRALNVRSPGPLYTCGAAIADGSRLEEAASGQIHLRTPQHRQRSWRRLIPQGSPNRVKTPGRVGFATKCCTDRSLSNRGRVSSHADRCVTDSAKQFTVSIRMTKARHRHPFGP